MRLAVLFVVLLGLLPAQAMALSCMRPTVEGTYAQASAASETYVVVAGRITLNTRKLPKSHSKSATGLTRVKADFSGKSLGRNGFETPFQRNITLEVSCFGPWCGSLRNGEQVLAFLRSKAGGYVLDVSPCGGWLFSNPDATMLKTVMTCFGRGACP